MSKLNENLELEKLSLLEGMFTDKETINTIYEGDKDRSSYTPVNWEEYGA